MNKGLEELRAEIDGIDRQMIDLFKARMEVAGQIAEYKRLRGLPVLDESREHALLNRVADRAGEELADHACSLYRTILSASRAYQDVRMGRCSEDTEE